MLRILHIGKFFPPATGGMENFLYDLTKYQSFSGVKTSVLVHHHTRILHKTAKINKFGINEYRTPFFGNLFYVPLPPILPTTIFDIIKREKPDIIHAHLPNLSAFSLLSKNIKVPIVLHWHSDVISSENDRTFKLTYNALYRAFEKLLLSKARAVIVTSKPYLDASRPLKSFRKKCFVVPLGIDPARLQTDNDSFGKPGGFLVASAGRFTYYKGFEYLIKALSLVPESHLIISGKGKLHGKLQKLVAEKGISDRVKLPGELPSKKLFALIKNCDVFCLPSIERTEAFGLVLLEAMYFGKPLISSRIDGSGISWVNKDGETGIQVRPKDEKALARAIDFMLSSPSARITYGTNAKKRFEKLFHIEKVCGQIRRIYETIL